MRSLFLVAALIAMVALLPAAEAQAASHLTVAMQAPAEPLKPEGSPLALVGTATYTADVTAYARLGGVPVTYVVTSQPEWATVVVSPANDVFPLPATPGGATITATRSFQVTISLARDVPETMTGLVEITAMTSPGMLDPGALAKTAVPVTVVIPEEEPPCPEEEHAQDIEQAVAAYEAQQASMREEDPMEGSSDEVSVQNAAASPLPLPWIAVAGFGLVGAGAGLVLRRRFR